RLAVLRDRACATARLHGRMVGTGARARIAVAAVARRGLGRAADLAVGEALVAASLVVAMATAALGAVETLAVQGHTAPPIGVAAQAVAVVCVLACLTIGTSDAAFAEDAGQVVHPPALAGLFARLSVVAPVGALIQGAEAARAIRGFEAVLAGCANGRA